MSRQDRDEMNPIQRDRYERRMATRRKSMFTNIIVGGVILAVVVAIIVVAVNMLNKPKTADTGSTDATVASATVSNPSAAATTAQQPTQTKNNNNSVQQNQQTQQNQQQGQAQQQYSTDVQLPAQSYGQATEQSGANSIEEINGERVYVDTKHEAPADTGTSYHYYTYGASPEGGFNWNYDADNGNFGISCNYNFDQQQYDFSVFGVSPGTANVTLYYYDTSGQWSPVNMTVTVDDNLNVYVG